MSMPTNGKVYIGLSGGVDSSVSAALLKKHGYDVTGVFIKVWTPDFIECTWKEERLDAMRVCAKLGIPFITLDLSKEYKKEVVDYMISEYKAGRTPNPDVMCNRHVKFGGFYTWAIANGADYVATGHYARTAQVQSPKSKVHKVGRGQIEAELYRPDRPYRLLTGLDSEKDQSYFLWTLTQEQLAHTLFPVGNLEKPKVRMLAKKFGLPTADKKDSQGLCFLGKINIKQFLRHYIKPKLGAVLNEEGKVIGEHDGATFFTLGERHGFKINKKTSDDKAYYVIGKDISRNSLVVSNDPRAGSTKQSRNIFELRDVNWICGAPKNGQPLFARIRYRQLLQKAKFQILHSKFSIQFVEPQTGGDSGQSVVIYQGKVCLGGGVIV